MVENLIDIHSHTLWGIDDGASSLRETLDMCSLAEESKTSTLFLTPHLIYWDSSEKLLDERDEKVEYLKETLYENEIDIDIKTGFEILCDDEIFSIKYFKPYTLNESRYILIEFDFFKTTEEDVISYCKYLKSFGLVPVIAHPERYNFVIQNKSVLDKLSDLGALFQINAGSPVGVFGEAQMNVACEMLIAGYVDFIGSDAHRNTVRNTDMYSFIEDYPYFVCESQIKLFAQENPLCIINDKKIAPKRLKFMAEI